MREGHHLEHAKQDVGSDHVADDWYHSITPV